jgi:hypothetical protein
MGSARRMDLRLLPRGFPQWLQSTAFKVAIDNPSRERTDTLPTTMTTNNDARVEPRQTETVMLTVKPAVKRLRIQRPRVRVIVLTLPSVRRPQVWL